MIKFSYEFKVNLLKIFRKWFFMRENNLFNWATSELSQDGFICWLMSFAKNPGINPQLEACAWDFIHRIPGLENAKRLISIERQVAVKIPGERKKGIIDVLLRSRSLSKTKSFRPPTMHR